VSLLLFTDDKVLNQILATVKRIETKLGLVQQQETQQMATLTELQTQVTESIGVEQSAITLIQGLAAKIQELINSGSDPAALQALVDELNTSEQALSGAVAANPVP
jgi:hypothetical protein